MIRPASPERRGRAAPPDVARRRLAEELLDRQDLLRAEMAAERWGVAPLEAAVALGLTSREALARMLAERLGATFLADGPDQPVLAGDPADWQTILDRGHVGLVRTMGGRAYCLAARPADAERLASVGHRLAGHGLPLVVMPDAGFDAMIRRWAEPHWRDGALDRLRSEEPGRSASDRRLMTRTALTCAVLIGLLALVLIAAPAPLALAAGGLVGLAVIAWSAIRVMAAVLPVRPLPRLRLADRDLPRYAILCALYREAEVAGQLVRALHRLDYPRVRLDILILTEADDEATRAALAAAAPDPAIRVLTLPPGGPATKPRALALGLPLARGELVVVYDAEDRPHPGQLREAAETFAAADDRLGCLQAPLAIANDRDSLLTRMFAAEYDALFRVLLPALARLGWPMPLGGTSNHFRRACLDQSLGWDPWNVTEDADLGFRIARNGWRSGAIALPTWEEAPARLGGWLGQRSRWFKGWLQTVAVLVREPRLLAAEIGWKGVLALFATIAGTLGSALVHVACLAALAVSTLLFGLPDWAGPAGLVAAAGFGASLVIKLTGLRRSGRLALTPWLALLPVVWAAMGVAALRAVAELARRPFHWEKTRHGLCAPADDGGHRLGRSPEPAALAHIGLAWVEQPGTTGRYGQSETAAARIAGRRNSHADPPSTVLPAGQPRRKTPATDKRQGRDGHGRDGNLPGSPGDEERVPETDRLDGRGMGRRRGPDPLPRAP